MTRTVHIATLPERSGSLALCVDSLYPQVDAIYVMLNGHESIPKLNDPLEKIHYELLDNSRGDAVKILDYDKREGFLFLCDDDLVYPPNYCEYMIAKYHQHPHSLITLHGKVFQRPVVSAHRGFRENYHCLHTVVGNHIVDTGGTGVMLINTADIKLDINRCLRKNMLDIWVGLLAHEQRVPIVAVEHRAGWLRYLSPPKTIWLSHTKEDDAYQVRILNSFIK